MSKIKEQIQRERDLMMGFNASFFDYIYDNLRNDDLSEDDINKMEEDFNKPSTVSNLILSKEALNNEDFNPRFGA